jgi:hypothetical protein
VVEVPWRDDFAAARNAAAAACRHDWLLSVDADERPKGDPSVLRGLLATAQPPALSVVVREIDAPGPRGVTSHRSVKLYRRTACAWSGRVHEQVVWRTGPQTGAPVPPTVAGEVDGEAFALVHHGYADAALVARKVARNLRLARLAAAELEETPTSAERRIAVLLDLGRTELSAGLHEEGARTLGTVRDLAAPGTAAWIWASDFLAWEALRGGDIDGAWALVGDLVDHGADESHLRPLAEQLLAGERSDGHGRAHPGVRASRGNRTAEARALGEECDSRLGD